MHNCILFFMAVLHFIQRSGGIITKDNYLMHRFYEYRPTEDREKGLSLQVGMEISKITIPPDILNVIYLRNIQWILSTM